MVKAKPTTRDIKAQHTKQIILETAVSLFHTKDYAQVTIEDITKAAGVSKGTFYLYFESKDSVLAEEFASLDEHYCRTVSNLPEAPLDRQLLYFTQQMCIYCQDTLGLNIMKTLYMNQISLELRMRLLNNNERPFYTIMTDFVQRGIENCIFRNDIEEHRILNILVRAIHGLIYDWCLYDGEFSLVDEGRKYMDFIIDSLKADKTGNCP